MPHPENTSNMADLLCPVSPHPFSPGISRPLESNPLPYGLGMTAMFSLCREQHFFKKGKIKSPVILTASRRQQSVEDYKRLDGGPYYLMNLN